MKKLIYSLFLVAAVSCNQGVELDSDESGSNAGQSIFSDGSTSSTKASSGDDGIIREMHEISVVEHIRGKRYSYLQVNEKGRAYWLATMGGDFKVGETYGYNEGIEKTQYHSTELNKTFDQILLVSALYRKETGHVHDHTNAQPQVVETPKPLKIHSKSILLRELITNSNQYKDKKVEVTGKVVKVNPDIMDKNWIHLQDGSMNSFDFVATSDELPPVGHVVTMTGMIRLNKDFGAGYTYDIILEGAKIKK